VPAAGDRMDETRRERAIRELMSSAEGEGVPSGRGSEPLAVFAGLGSALRRLRVRRGLTQRQAAAAAGMTRAMISDFEREAVVPSVRTLDRLLRALGVSVDELARELEDPGR